MSDSICPISYEWSDSHECAGIVHQDDRTEKSIPWGFVIQPPEHPGGRAVGTTRFLCQSFPGPDHDSSSSGSSINTDLRFDGRGVSADYRNHPAKERHLDSSIPSGAPTPKDGNADRSPRGWETISDPIPRYCSDPRIRLGKADRGNAWRAKSHPPTPGGLMRHRARTLVSFVVALVVLLASMVSAVFQPMPATAASQLLPDMRMAKLTKIVSRRL